MKPNKMEVNKELLIQAIEKWGENAQVDMVIEECAELIQAIQKVKRNGIEDHQTWTNIVEETADVIIMTNQLRIILKSDSAIEQMINKKMHRLEKRLTQPKQ